MHQWIKLYLEKNKLTTFDFFRSAYYWNFQQILTSRTDSNLFEKSEVIPIWVARYTQFIREQWERRQKGGSN